MSSGPTPHSGRPSSFDSKYRCRMESLLSMRSCGGVWRAELRRVSKKLCWRQSMLSHSKGSLLGTSEADTCTDAISSFSRFRQVMSWGQSTQEDQVRSEVRRSSAVELMQAVRTSLRRSGRLQRADENLSAARQRMMSTWAYSSRSATWLSRRDARQRDRRLSEPR